MSPLSSWSIATNAADTTALAGDCLIVPAEIAYARASACHGACGVASTAAWHAEFIAQYATVRASGHFANGGRAARSRRSCLCASSRSERRQYTRHRLRRGMHGRLAGCRRSIEPQLSGAAKYGLGQHSARTSARRPAAEGATVATQHAHNGPRLMHKTKKTAAQPLAGGSGRGRPPRGGILGRWARPRVFLLFGGDISLLHGGDCSALRPSELSCSKLGGANPVGSSAGGRDCSLRPPSELSCFKLGRASPVGSNPPE